MMKKVKVKLVCATCKHKFRYGVSKKSRFGVKCPECGGRDTHLLKIIGEKTLNKKRMLGAKLIFSLSCFQ